MTCFKYLIKHDFYLTRSGLGRVLIPSSMQPDSTCPAYFNPAEVRRLPGGGVEKINSSRGRQHPYRGCYLQGQVVLVNGGSFSAASNLAASLRAQRRVTIIGQETGGGEAGCNGGTISELELPKTHFLLHLPHFQMLAACPHPQLGRGVCPDIEVVPTPRQVAAHADPILEQLSVLLHR